LEPVAPEQPDAVREAERRVLHAVIERSRAQSRLELAFRVGDAPREINRKMEEVSVADARIWDEAKALAAARGAGGEK